MTITKTTIRTIALLLIAIVCFTAPIWHPNTTSTIERTYTVEATGHSIGNDTEFTDIDGNVWEYTNYYADENDVFMLTLKDNCTSTLTDDEIVNIEVIDVD